MRNNLLTTFFILFSFNLFAQPAAQFIADTTSGCAPLEVNFTNQSNGAISYQWKFGDGNYSSQSNPTNLYTKAGVYTVTLISINSAQRDTLVKSAYIQVFPKPIINYALPDSVQCLFNDSIQLINLGDTAHNYTWVFGDGTTSNSYNAVHQYISSGSFRTLLAASTTHGCTAQKSLAKRINVIANPVAYFTADTSLICRDQQVVRFTSASSSNLKHYWDFGDGNKDSLNNKVTHIYQNEGEFDVTLSVEDSKGCETELKQEKYIKFNKPPKAQIEISQDTICSRQAINFSIDSFWVAASWNFETGSSSNELNPSHAFSNPGMYSVRVNLTDSIGCNVLQRVDSIVVKETPIASVKDTSIVACAPFSFQPTNTSFYATSYQWKLDTFQLTGFSPRFTISNAGAVDLRLIASNDFCSDTLHYSNLLQLEGGKRTATLSDTLGCAPMKVHFSTENVDSASLTWHFGNGDTSNSEKPNYVYQLGGTYQPFLISRTANSCIDTVFLKEIQVIDAQSVFNRPDTIVLCQPGTVSFDGASIGGNFWRWDFDDGDTSNAANPQHFFDTAGTYTVELLTQNTQGCFYRLKPYNVVVVKASKANFTMNVDNCPDFKVSFTATDSDILSWKWEFGDDIEDTIPNPIHYYAEEGAYTVSLSTWDKDGCFSKRTLINGLQLYPCIGDSVNSEGLGGSLGGKNVFSDTSDAIIACSPFQLELFMPLDSVKNQWWNFGDGHSSILQHPIHTYQTAGNFTLQLIVEFENGKFDTIQNQNYIQIGNPKAAFTYQIENRCDSISVLFTNHSTRASNYFWDLDAAGISNQYNTNANYKEASNQLISLTATDDKGCFHTIKKNIGVGTSNPYFKFKANACLGEQISFESNIQNYDRLVWQIGNQVHTGDTVYCMPADTGLYTISVKAYDRNNCAKTFVSPVKLRVSNPIANFSFNEGTEACDALNLDVNNLSTGALEFTWFFGNGDSLKGRQAIYTFKNEGEYTLRLKAEHYGCSNVKQASQKIIINKAKADFEIQQNNVCLPIQANFIDRSVAAVSWLWEFGDGASSTAQNPTHVFHTKAGKQKLSIVDVNGCKASKEKAALRTHRATAVADTWEGCIPLTVQFNDTTPNVQSYHWDFGDGTSSNLRNPQHIYSQPGKYDLKLITRSIEGCSDTLIMEKAIVAGKVIADFFSESNVNACSPHLTSFKNTSEGAINFKWIFGDGTDSKFENPVKVYHKAGIFDVTLMADNGHSCADTVVSLRRFNINTPEINFNLSDSIVCGPSNIQFNDLSKRVNSRKWFFGDGTVATQRNPSHFFDQLGTSTVTLMVTDTAGCVETLSKRVTVKEKPTALFFLDTLKGCSPVAITFKNRSQNLLSPKFLWRINQNEIKTVALDTSILFSKRGSYDIGLIAINSNKCADTLIHKDHLNVFQTKTVQQSKIMSVSRTEKNDLEILWEKNSAFEFKMYRLFRKTSLGDFEEIHRTENRESKSFNLAFNSNLEGIQCFKIETIYHCVDSIDVNLLDTYCSIDLRAKADSNGIHLEWNTYQTASFEAYEIWREPIKGGKKQFVSRVDKSLTQATDSTTLCPQDYSYRIKAINIYGKGFQALSDSVIVKPQNSISDIDLTIKRVTVLQDNQVLLEWEDPNYSPQVVNGYRLERLQTRGGYKFVRQFPLGISSFIDDYTASDNQSIGYKLSLDHNCRFDLKVEQTAASIWLSIERDGSINHLKWTPATGLKDGVQFYHIQLKNSNGNWETIKTLDANQLDTFIDSYQLEK
tara:strand:- start:23430 stop:28694 length:5265 start_codon:yes stop_codon:yes gene_type:complete